MPQQALDIDAIVLRLREQMERAEITLFTGAGFSYGALDYDGQPVPQVDDLRREIAELTWPDDPFDENSTLQDTYAAALVEAKGKLTSHLRKRLSVDPESVTNEHALWLSMPWHRAYTVNVDDLEIATARHTDLPRKIRPYSAINTTMPPAEGGDLLYVHLNGTIDDIPDVTFTEPQYGRRLGRPSYLYEQLTAELLSYPVIFIGTTLREPLFWQYITLRDDRGPRGVTEHRPASYLVCPALSPDRRRLLGTYNIRWVPMTASDFANRVLTQLEDSAKTGLRRLCAAPTDNRVYLPTVAELASLPDTSPSEYLMGSRPRWDDIRTGRAVARVFDGDISADLTRGVLLVTGTAGAGTSTTLKRLALRMLGQDRDVRWLDADDEIDIHALGRWLRNTDKDLVLFIDDADTRGRTLNDLLADARASLVKILIVLGMRAVRIDKTLREWRPNEQGEIEIVVPLLQDEDIVLLLCALEQDNKLGVLTRLTQEERESRFREGCGRELLVAMFEATTGERFEAKIAGEYGELEGEQKLIYAIAAIATDMRAYLLKDEILMASGDLSNTSLFALDRLAARGLLASERNRYRLRHRRIAEVVMGRLRQSSELLAPYQGLLGAMASRYQGHERASRESRLFTALLSHRLVGRNFALDDARALYQSLEAACAGDYHYWLQRGSYEVKFGSLSHARSWLAQAKQGDGENDRRVSTEWAYYLLKSARQNPNATDVEERVAEGRQLLEDHMQGYGDDDAYPWHVYGSQLKGWLRVASLGDDERARQLEKIIAVVREGAAKHPGERELQVLLRDLEKDLLMLSVPFEDRA
jgi:hypothetical protein